MSAKSTSPEPSVNPAQIITRRRPGVLRPLMVFGTRPEAIKMAPVINECAERPGEIRPIICSTGQHREMLDQVLNYFSIRPDVELALMQPGQSLSGLTARCLEALDRVVVEREPDCVVAQGDTTTVLVAALAAFYHRLPFVHVEAGLRTGDLAAPWPEEFNRRVASIVTTLHCAPTDRAQSALLAEGVDPDRIRITGNTVIDALFYTADKERADDASWRQKYPMALAESVVLVTGHRRENFGGGLEQICAALDELSREFPQTQFVYPVHLNPNVQEPVHRMLGGAANIHLVPPADYPEFVWLMDQASVVLTDSGGVQEEAPSLGNVVLVTRTKTERPEAVEAGLAELVGTDRRRIVRCVSETLSRPRPEQRPEQRSEIQNPYGDGHAAKRIVDWMLS